MVDLKCDDAHTVLFVNDAVRFKFLGENGNAFRRQLLVFDADFDVIRIGPFEI